MNTLPKETRTPTQVEQAMIGGQHKHWLHDTTTSALVKRIDVHEQNIIAKIANAAVKEDISTEYVRLLASQLATVRAIKKLAFDTETFVDQTVNKKETQ